MLLSMQLCDPLVSWASSEFGTTFTTGDSIFGVQQPAEVEVAVEQFLIGIIGLLSSPPFSQDRDFLLD